MNESMYQSVKDLLKIIKENPTLSNMITRIVVNEIRNVGDFREIISKIVKEEIEKELMSRSRPI